MGDSRLRELERRWRDTASLDDEAAWLRERARSGDLLKSDLYFAARLGHTAATIATGRKPGPEPDLFAGPHQPGRWATPWRDGFRIMRAAQRRVLDWWAEVAREMEPEQLHGEELEVYRRCQVVSGEWFADPSAANALCCLSAARAAWALGKPYENRRPVRHLARTSAVVAFLGARHDEPLRAPEKRRRIPQLPGAPDTIRTERISEHWGEVTAAIHWMASSGDRLDPSALLQTCRDLDTEIRTGLLRELFAPNDVGDHSR